MKTETPGGLPMMWRRLDNPGHEWARLSTTPSGPVLIGTAVFMEDKVPGRIDYKIQCNSGWETMTAEIRGWAGNGKIKIRVEAGEDKTWRTNGHLVSGVKGCLDIDLSFSPSTNLLPIRRLNLGIGQKAEVRAAWLRFPDFDLIPLVHRFHRESENLYFYDSDIGFSTKLTVDSEGFVTDYPPLWTKETGD